MPEVVIVGGGLAGLACATRLSQTGIDFQLLEATERVGGRVRTDVVERFQLDHGFQFLPCDDPLARQLLDYDPLRLRKFAPQLLVRAADRFRPLASDALLPTRSPFWRRMLRRFVSGEAAVPAGGMAAIPRQLAERLPRGSLALQHTVVGLRTSGVPLSGVPSSGVEVSGVQLSDGSSLEARVVVLATESPAADRLTNPLRTSAEERFDGPWDAVQTIYFSAAAGVLGDPSPTERSLMLCGDDASGPVHHVAVLSRIAAEYAPPGRELVSVSLAAERGDSGPPPMGPIRRQLRSWFGDGVDSWEHLRTYAVPYAAPAQTADARGIEPRSVEPFGETGPVVCGDHRETGTIAGAMNSGLRAAEAVCRRLG